MKTTFLTLILALAGVSTRANELEFAIDKALQAPRSDFLQSAPAAFLSLSNIHLKLHPVFLLEKKGPVHTLAGTIEQDDAAGKTRTIAYRITKQGGTIKNIVLQIDDDMPQAVSASMRKAMGRFFEPGPMEEDERARLMGALHATVDGTWLSVVELVVARIGLRHC